jgi:chromosome segregation ATPase
LGDIKKRALGVLYLAEVHRKTGFMGGKTELKLLARQQSEQNWSTLPGEEVIPVEIASEYNSGVLVLVELDANQQVKKVQDATRHLVGILKNFSRMREKFRTQEEEIEGWKQSLIYQSQELTRREVDIEARSEELQQLETESHKIEEQLQEFEQTRAQVLQLKEEIDLDRQQLEEAWGRLHGAQQQHEQSQSSAALTDEQVQHLEGLMNQLESNLFTEDTLRQSLQGLRNSSNNQQAVLQPFWDRLNQERSQAESAPAELDHQAQLLTLGWQAWHQEQETLIQLQIQQKLQQETLGLKQTQRSLVAHQLQLQVDLENSLQSLRNGVTGNVQVDLDALQGMPLNSLEETVDKLQKELTKLSRFVADQEEELKLQDQTIDELRSKISLVSEYERMNMASDLEDEQQNYRLLEETLQGQRQTLRDRDSVLKLHREVLNQRKGIVSEDNNELAQQINPLLAKVSVHRQALQDALQALERELNSIQETLEQTQSKVNAASTSLTQKRAELESQSKALDERRMEVGQLQGRVGALGQTLQPIQDQIDSFNHSLDEFWPPLESATAEQQRVALDLKQTIMTLGQVGEGPV